MSLDAARWMAFQNHVPGTVIYVIAVVGLLAAIVVGYTFAFVIPITFAVDPHIANVLFSPAIGQIVDQNSFVGRLGRSAYSVLPMNQEGKQK
jgi:hypothetical protein